MFFIFPLGGMRREVLHIATDFNDLLSFLQKRLEVTERVEWKEVVEKEVRRDHPERWWETITVIERVRRGEVMNREPTKEELMELLTPMMEGGSSELMPSLFSIFLVGGWREKWRWKRRKIR